MGRTLQAPPQPHCAWWRHCASIRPGPVPRGGCREARGRDVRPGLPLMSESGCRLAPSVDCLRACALSRKIGKCPRTNLHGLCDRCTAVRSPETASSGPPDDSRFVRLTLAVSASKSTATRIGCWEQFVSSAGGHGVGRSRVGVAIRSTCVASSDVGPHWGTNVGLRYQSSVCDNCIGDTTDSSPPEQCPGRGDPHRGRWAPIFDVAGPSDTFVVGHPQ